MDLSFFGTDLNIWLAQYGSIALFILLGLGIFGLPVPEETLMLLAGILMSAGELKIVPTVLAAYFGTVCGITISYFLGRTAGRSLLNKYGSVLQIESRPFHQSTKWFSSFSKWTLLIGYLIPGLRHLTGIFAGSTAMEFKEFCLFAYSGAFLWVSLFLSIGYFLGHNFLIYATHLQNIELVMDLFAAVLVLFFIIYLIYLIKLNKSQ